MRKLEFIDTMKWNPLNHFVKLVYMPLFMKENVNKLTYPTLPYDWTMLHIMNGRIPIKHKRIINSGALRQQ